MSCFDRLYDLIVYGAGCAGFACAHAAAEQGRSVLLVDGRGDLLWEFGRAFAPAHGDCNDERWQRLLADAAAAGVVGHGHVGGAAMEVLAAEQLRDGLVDHLFYAWPLALDLHDDGIAGLVVACKEGRRRLRALSYVDASEDAVLLRLTGQDARPQASRHQATVHFQATTWAGDEAFIRSGLPQERVLVYDCPQGEPPWRSLPEHLEAHAAVIDNAVLSHASWVSLPHYAASDAVQAAAVNLTLAVPGLSGRAITTPADRWLCGLAAAEGLAGRRTVEAVATDAPLPPITAPVDDCQVCVIGIGTGGSHAAIAAGRQGAQTIAIEPLPLIGGIGTGGGIHGYYYGVESGQQLELDRATEAFMQATPGMAVVRKNGGWAAGGWHYLAKCIVLDRELQRHGVDARYGTVLADVVCQDGRIVEAIIAGEQGPQRIRAGQWIDGSGDADLCRLAGADSQRGREHDGLYHAYTQSSGRINCTDGLYSLGNVNFDAGWCDPSHSESLGDGRLQGICQYRERIGDPSQRTTYIAPAIGLRQGPQVACEEMISFDDLLMSKRYDDEIAVAAADYDNHATDFHWESDEGLFWMWAARNRSEPVACGISYRGIQPRGIANCLIASRCLGVSQDAHYALRMQRDLERIGEAAGIAAALCAARGIEPRALPVEDLHDALGAALELPDADHRQGLFGKHGSIAALAQPGSEERIAAGLASLDEGSGGRPLWWLYRDRAACEPAVLARLDDGDELASWFAACVLAIWGDERAEPRLLRALRSREWGYSEQTDRLLRPRMPSWMGDQPLNPSTQRHLVPNWFCAMNLLRCCGTAASLDAIEELVMGHNLILQGRCAVALAIAGIGKRHQLDGDQLARIAERLRSEPIPDRVHNPQTWVGGKVQQCIDGDLPPEIDHGATCEDHRWQLDLAIAKMLAIEAAATAV